MKVVAVHGISVALACRTFQISETCYRYSPTLSDENEEIADWLERLTANKRTWGFGGSVMNSVYLVRPMRVSDTVTH